MAPPSICQDVSHNLSASQLRSMLWAQPVDFSLAQSLVQRRSSRGRAVLLSAKLCRANARNASVDKTTSMDEVVIAGGGIAGLATALALHRVGIKSVVLEQSPSLRITGTALGMWTNGWKALDALGIADGLRGKFQKLSGFEFYTTDGLGFLDLPFPTRDRDVELRAVDRRVLLEALADSLPAGTICYDSRVVNIYRLEGGYTQVELQNGSTKQAKVLIGCDGIGSVVAKNLGLGAARYVGYMGIRGLASFPEGHSFKYTLSQTMGGGVRVGLLPMDSKKVYWFLVFNHAPGEKVADPQLIKEEALRYVEGWPQTIIDVVKRSPLETLSRAAISDRWMWPYGGPKLYQNGVTVAGDAMHPVTPNLAQGGCSALEDGVVLARVLSKALGKGQEQIGLPQMKMIELALESYIDQRRKRMFPVAVQAYAIGAMLQLDQQALCSLRDFLMPRLLTVDRYIEHSFFDCGKLA